MLREGCGSPAIGFEDRSPYPASLTRGVAVELFQIVQPVPTIFSMRVGLVSVSDLLQRLSRWLMPAASICADQRQAREVDLSGHDLRIGFR